MGIWPAVQLLGPRGIDQLTGLTRSALTASVNQLCVAGLTTGEFTRHPLKHPSRYATLLCLTAATTTTTANSHPPVGFPTLACILSAYLPRRLVCHSHFRPPPNNENLRLVGCGKRSHSQPPYVPRTRWSGQGRFITCLRLVGCGKHLHYSHY